MQVPGIKVSVNNQDISSLVSSFELTSSLYGGMDSLSLSFRDVEKTVTSGLSRGQAVSLKWGYDKAKIDLFEGVMFSVNPQQDDVTVKALDHSVIFNSIMISKTFVGETAANILKNILSQSGLTLKIEDSDLEYKIFPALNESAASILQKITKDVTVHSSFPQIFHTRGSTFTWKKLNTNTTPVFEFATGHNIIKWVEGKELTTMIVPVLCGDMITINDSDYLVESAIYRWDRGGRTMLGVTAV